MFTLLERLLHSEEEQLRICALETLDRLAYRSDMDHFFVAMDLGRDLIPIYKDTQVDAQHRATAGRIISNILSCKFLGVSCLCRLSKKVILADEGRQYMVSLDLLGEALRCFDESVRASGGLSKLLRSSASILWTLSVNGLCSYARSNPTNCV